MIYKLLCLVSIAVLLVGCGEEPTIDTENLDMSLAEIRGTLNESEKGQFDVAMRQVMGRYLTTRSLMGGPEGIEKAHEKMYKVLEGKTAQQVIVMVKKQDWPDEVEKEKSFTGGMKPPSSPY